MMCIVCGNPDKKCCKLSPYVPFDKFVKRYFNATYIEGKGYVEKGGEILPVSIAQEFYSDYRTSGVSLKKYIEQTTFDYM